MKVLEFHIIYASMKKINKKIILQTVNLTTFITGVLVGWSNKKVVVVVVVVADAPQS